MQYAWTLNAFPCNYVCRWQTFPNRIEKEKKSNLTRSELVFNWNFIGATDVRCLFNNQFQLSPLAHKLENGLLVCFFFFRCGANRNRQFANIKWNISINILILSSLLRIPINISRTLIWYCVWMFALWHVYSMWYSVLIFALLQNDITNTVHLFNKLKSRSILN